MLVAVIPPIFAPQYVSPHHGPLAPNEYLAEVASRYPAGPVDTISNVADLPADAIAAVVGESDDRVVCMTSHGRGGLRWSVLGSTAEASGPRS